MIEPSTTSSINCVPTRGLSHNRSQLVRQEVLVANSSQQKKPSKFKKSTIDWIYNYCHSVLAAQNKHINSHFISTVNKCRFKIGERFILEDLKSKNDGLHELAVSNKPKQAETNVVSSGSQSPIIP
ncbi:hypothetical protein JTB14_001156 [Gonioctena quinquepunctata]|nr:hypothetical protein JTB14_001156 [Gonioctena quinquepunctata]